MRKIYKEKKKTDNPAEQWKNNPNSDRIVDIGGKVWYHAHITQERGKHHEEVHRYDAHGDAHVLHVHALLCSDFDGLSDKRMSTCTKQARVIRSRGSFVGGSLFLLT